MEETGKEGDTLSPMATTPRGVARGEVGVEEVVEDVEEVGEMEEEMEVTTDKNKTIRLNN